MSENLIQDFVQDILVSPHPIPHDPLDPSLPSQAVSTGTNQNHQTKQSDQKVLSTALSVYETKVKGKVLHLEKKVADSSEKKSKSFLRKEKRLAGESVRGSGSGLKRKRKDHDNENTASHVDDTTTQKKVNKKKKRALSNTEKKDSKLFDIPKDSQKYVGLVLQFFLDFLML
jgi:hypothetical protein